MTDIVLAHPHANKATFYQARRAFADGATVVVTERNEGDTIFVYPSTTTHSRESCTWEYLATAVRDWRNRYPRQTFYIVHKEEAA